MSRWALVLLLLAGCGRQPRLDPGLEPAAVDATHGADAAGALPAHRVFPDAAKAMQAILDRQPSPRVIGFGEFHALTGGPQVPSALRRFREELFPLLAPTVSDLVIETWVSEGNCGDAEAKVQTDVPQRTDRPPETTSEIEELALAARKVGTQPHALTLRCADYRAILGKDGEVDFDRMLDLLTRELLRVASSTVRVRDLQKYHRHTVAVYGGALHNDLYPPDEESRRYSYALELAKTVPSYVEVDLFVPEIVESNEFLKGESWFPLLAATARDHVVLYERGPRSYVILLDRSAAPATRPAPGLSSGAEEGTR